MVRRSWCAVVAVLACVSCSSAPVEPVAQVRTLFPGQAAQALGDGARTFATTDDGFTLAQAAGRHEAIALTLPKDAAAAARFELGEGFTVSVTELGARDPSRLAANSIAFTRDNGTSFWTPTEVG